MPDVSTASLPDYRPREIRFVRLWHQDDWTLKIYGINAREVAADQPIVPPEFVTLACRTAASEISSCATEQTDLKTGFIVVHAGTLANWILVGWWYAGILLRCRLFRAGDTNAELPELMTNGLAACVWELRVVEYERQAWVEHVLKPASVDGIQSYLSDRCNEFH